MLGPVPDWWSVLSASQIVLFLPRCNYSPKLSSSYLGVITHLNSLLPPNSHLLKPGPLPASGICQGTHALPQIGTHPGDPLACILTQVASFAGSQSFCFPSISGTFQVLYVTYLGSLTCFQSPGNCMFFKILFTQTNS